MWEISVTFVPMGNMMRTICFILFLLCLCACGNRPYPRSLLIADSLTNVFPDSAITLLVSLKDSMATQAEATQMYYRLLCIKAKDKAYLPNTSDSFILPVLHYYIMENDRRHLPEAYYYAGRVCRDLGDAPQALEYFEKALDAMEGDSNYRLKSVIYSQMGTLFSFQDIVDEALKTFRNAYQCDSILNDSAGMAFDFQDLAWTYLKKDQSDSALYYYRAAYDLAHTIQYQNLIVSTQCQMAYIYIQMKEYDLAKKALHPALNNLIIPGKSGIYSIASEFYHETGQIDSAIYYYNELLTCGTIYAKQAAYHGLAKIAISKGAAQEALGQIQQYIQCTDSIQKIINTETIRKMYSLYNYQLREKENNLLKMENEQKEQFIVYISSVCIIMIFLFIAYLQYSKRKKLQLNIQLEKLEELKKEQYRKSTQFIEENNAKIEELEDRQRHTDQENSFLKKQLQRQQEIILCTNKQIEFQIEECEQARVALFNSDIYTHFKSLIHSDKKLTDDDWIQLENAINSAYNGFVGKLYKLHTISEHELHVCLLIKIDILPNDIANLTNHSKESIASTRRRLFEKVFLNKGKPKDWDEFIMSL